MDVDQEAALSAIRRLMTIASQDTGQSRRVANFLLAWHNAEGNGGWDPVIFGLSMRRSPPIWSPCCSSCATTIPIRQNWASRKKSRQSGKRGGARGYKNALTGPSFHRA